MTDAVTIFGHIEVTSRSQICSDPILILHFILDTLAPFASPAAIMREALQPYRPTDHIQYHEVIFDIGTPKKTHEHLESMKKLMDRVKHLEYEHVEVFIYSHSETERGDIWGGFEDCKFVGKGRNKVSIRGQPVAYTIGDVSKNTLRSVVY